MVGNAFRLPAVIHFGPDTAGHQGGRDKDIVQALAKGGQMRVVPVPLIQERGGESHSCRGGLYVHPARVCHAGGEETGKDGIVEML